MQPTSASGTTPPERPTSGRPLVCILGNSVALKIRPPRRDATERTYGELLESAGWSVRNLSRAGVTIADAFAFYEDDIISRFPDAVIFNFGVVEVSRRRLFRRVWYGAAPHNMFLNRLTGRPHPSSLFTRRLRRWPWVLVGKISEWIARTLRVSWTWLTPAQLTEVQGEMLKLLFKETAACAVVLGANPCSDRVETILPGTRRSIAEANQALGKLVSNFPRAAFIDPAVCIPETDAARLIPDGVHYSAEGHRALAGRIVGTLQQLGVNPASA